MEILCGRRRSRLLPFLIIMHRLAHIKESILSTSEREYAALILIKQVIPCIMHMENQVGEKLITVLIGIRAPQYQNERIISSLEG